MATLNLPVHHPGPAETARNLRGEGPHEATAPNALRAVSDRSHASSELSLPLYSLGQRRIRFLCESRGHAQGVRPEIHPLAGYEYNQPLLFTGTPIHRER